MDTIVGIDLGTTNSEIAVIRDGKVEMIPMEDGSPIHPSVVGFDQQGNLLVGQSARNQLLVAPERTVKSIKRKMGEETTVKLADKSFTPQEISAMILRSLKQRAEKVLGQPVKKAVITVPAFFNDGQRQATREAGELAGLEVVRIINEPTAAVLTYDANLPEMERILVYDLGGGTFDVSIAQVESGVVEILSSHGDTHLGGDDFDQLLLDHVCDQFKQKHSVDLRQNPVAKSRVLRAVEDAKKTLSSDVSARLEEEFIAEKDGSPINLVTEIKRETYEKLIEGLLNKTLVCVDQSLTDSKLQAHQINKVLLVGGATRTPIVHRMLSERMGRPVRAEIEPDLAVAMGAAVQGGLIAGSDVGPVLIDITPHTLGIECLGIVLGASSQYCFSEIIDRNTSLPSAQTEIYSTVFDEQDAARIRVFQGENDDTRYNDFVGEFTITGLAPVPRGNQISVKLELDLNGILKVTATERATGLEKHIVIDNAAERFKIRERADAIHRLEAAFRTLEQEGEMPEGAEAGAGAGGLGEGGVPAQDLSPEVQAVMDKANAAIAKADKLIADGGVNDEDAIELKEKLNRLRVAVAKQDAETIQGMIDDFNDMLFYIEGGGN